jgi:GGDEF domain-containing protein
VSGTIASLVYEQQINRVDGMPIWIDWRASRVVINRATGATRLVGMFRDITARKRAELATEHRAMHDPLTDLPNRITFEEQLKRARAEAEEQERKIAVMFLDLDRFKAVNDTYGHDCGDRLLVEVGRRLQGCVRKSDLVARFGGDEFALLAPDY